jgi:hypothetical protein
VRAAARQRARDAALFDWRQLRPEPREPRVLPQQAGDARHRIERHGQLGGGLRRIGRIGHIPSGRQAGAALRPRQQRGLLGRRIGRHRGGIGGGRGLGARHRQRAGAVALGDAGRRVGRPLRLVLRGAGAERSAKQKRSAEAQPGSRDRICHAGQKGAVPCRNKAFAQA